MNPDSLEDFKDYISEQVEEGNMDEWEQGEFFKRIYQFQFWASIEDEDDLTQF